MRYVWFRNIIMSASYVTSVVIISFPQGAGLILSLEASVAKEVRSSFRR